MHKRCRLAPIVTLVGILACSIKALPGAAEPPPRTDSQQPTQVLWGDTHLHTSYSADAFSMGNRALTPEQAFAFARGELVTASNGMSAQLHRPLDFLVVADHAEYLGALAALRGDDPILADFPRWQRWAQQLTAGGAQAKDVINTVGRAFTQAQPLSEDNAAATAIQLSTWKHINSVAAAANTPGEFSAFAGFEWTSMPEGDNLHRVVMFRDDAERTTRMAPFSAVDSLDPEQLWNYLERYELTTGGRALAIPHNGNVSNGRMFSPTTFSGEAIDRNYAQKRRRWEPVVEVTQIKGDGEAHPLLSPNDEFADYGTWDTGNIWGTSDKEPWMLQYEYARSALKLGLKLERETGVNPFGFGMIGSTDAHNALAASEEDNFWGKSASHEPAPDRTRGRFVKDVPVSPKVQAWEQVASGYAAVWAQENSRTAIFDAMQRREVYATTGPRMTVRFFGGWEYSAADSKRKDFAAIGYRKGVPMGGTLPPPADPGQAPRFLVAVQKDAAGANLDRVQIVKGWLDSAGESHEKVYDVAWSGDRKREAKGDGDGDNSLESVGDTVDRERATYDNSIGATQLASVWTDPDFDPSQPAFYYVRVLEIPTPRWVAYDRAQLGADVPEAADLVHQERAYTSPIWWRTDAQQQ